MNRRDTDYLHREALGYGEWAVFGMDRCGLGSNMPETTKKKKKKPAVPHIRTEMEKLGIPTPQPHSTRQRPSSKLLLYKTNERYRKIHRIAVQQPIEVKHIIILLYYRAMPFRDVAVVTGLPSRQVGERKHQFLSAISEVLC